MTKKDWERLFLYKELQYLSRKYPPTIIYAIETKNKEKAHVDFWLFFSLGYYS